MKKLFLLLALLVAVPAFATVTGETVIDDGTVVYTIQPAASTGCEFTPNDGVVSAEYALSPTGCPDVLAGMEHVLAGGDEYVVHDGATVYEISPGDTAGRFKVLVGTTEFSPSESASAGLVVAFKHAIAN